MSEINNNQIELPANYQLEHYSIIRTLGRGGVGGMQLVIAIIK